MATSGDQVSGTRRAVVDWASDAGSVPGLADRRHAVPVPWSSCPRREAGSSAHGWLSCSRMWPGRC